MIKTMESASSGGVVINTKQTHVNYDKISAMVSPASKQLSSDRCDKSPSVCETPVRVRRLSKICEDEVLSAKPRPSTPGISLSSLPIHSTPPSGVSNVIIKNPFEDTLRKTLHMPVITPTLFSRVISPSQDTDRFSWSIEDLAEMHAAEIDEYQVQSDHSHEELSEDEVQRRIKEFFDSRAIVESPWSVVESQKAMTLPLVHLSSPSVPQLKVLKPASPLSDMEVLEEEKENCGRLSLIKKKDAWTQTELTFACDVPSEVDSVMEDFSMMVGEQEEEKAAEELLEQAEERKPLRSMGLISSPLCLSEPVCSSPCHKLRMNLLSSSLHTPKAQVVRSFGTPLGRASLISPIGLSPIMHTLQNVTVTSEVATAGDSIEAFWTSGAGFDVTSLDSGISTTISQTDMTLPCVLPKYIEDVLKPFCTFVQDQPDGEVILNSSLSRRRKLFFNDALNMSTSSIAATDVGYISS